MNKTKQDYSAWVKEVATALHEDCVLEWQAIAVTDPTRQVTMHMTDAHYGRAHDLVRRLKLDGIGQHIARQAYNQGWLDSASEAQDDILGLRPEALEAAIHHAGLVLVDQVSGKIVEDGVAVVSRRLGA